MQPENEERPKYFGGRWRSLSRREESEIHDLLQEVLYIGIRNVQEKQLH
jgi:hypothetical protein